MARWEFWIDVGGTFTDSFARSPDGRRRHYKVLSSGIIKGAAGPGSSARQIVDAARGADPDEIWTGYRLVLLDQQGAAVCESTVQGFNRASATLTLTRPLPVEPSGSRYELSADIEAPIVAIRYLLGLPLAAPIPPVNVRLGTTRGTNALITRRAPGPRSSRLADSPTCC